jgi:hypothetical protein
MLPFSLTCSPPSPFGLADQFKLALEREGMTTPHPQRDVLHLRNGQVAADSSILRG